jgi:N-acetylmuramoyl-L-alanine amidase
VGGKLLLSLEKSGKLQFFGKTLTVDGQAIKLKGGKIKKVGAGAAATVTAQPVKEPFWIDLELRDKEGKAVPREKFRVELPDGSVRRGALDEDGKARVGVPTSGTCRVTLTRLDAELWKVVGGGAADRAGDGASLPPRDYTVRGGDCIASIAWALGHHWRTIWEHSRNSSLREQRKNPNVLLAGDRVFVPERQLGTVSVRTGQKGSFELKAELAAVRFRLNHLQTAYVLEFDDGTTLEGTTDGGGFVEATPPPRAKTGTLRIETDLGSEIHALHFGHLDPVSEIGAVQQRLRNLGFACVVSGEPDDVTRRVLAEFQQQNGLEASGEADEATCDKLARIHGS